VNGDSHDNFERKRAQRFKSNSSLSRDTRAQPPLSRCPEP